MSQRLPAHSCVGPLTHYGIRFAVIAPGLSMPIEVTLTCLWRIERHAATGN